LRENHFKPTSENERLHEFNNESWLKLDKIYGRIVYTAKMFNYLEKYYLLNVLNNVWGYVVAQ
jgi:hypothetical protein